MGDKILNFGKCRGVNTLHDPADLKDDEVAWAEDLYTPKPGVLGKRPGAVTLQQLVPNSGNFTAVFDIAEAPWAPGTLFIAWLDCPWDWYGGAGNASIRVGVYTGGVLTEFYAKDFNATTFTSEFHPRFQEFNGSLYMLNGPQCDLQAGLRVGPPSTAYTNFLPGSVGKYEGFDLAGAGNGALRPAAMTIYKSRIIYWGFKDAPYSLLFSDGNDPLTVGDDALSANGYAIDFPVGNITACVEVMPTSIGSELNSMLLVFSDKETYVFTGEPRETTDNTGVPVEYTYSANKMVTDAGCASQKTIVRTPHGVFWASRNDVWLYKGGQEPVRVGAKIRPELQRNTVAQSRMWYAGFVDGFYRLAVAPENGQWNFSTYYDDFGYAYPAHNNIQFWLDIRKLDEGGEWEPIWWGPHYYFTGRGIQGFYTTKMDTEETRGWYVDDGYDGYLALRLVGLNGTPGQDKYYGLNDETYNYYGLLRTKEYSTEDTNGMARQLYDSASIFLMSSNLGFKYTIDAMLDGGRKLNVGTAYPESVGYESVPGETQRFLEGLLGTANVSQESHSFRVVPASRSTRVTAYRVQFTLQDITGIHTANAYVNHEQHVPLYLTYHPYPAGDSVDLEVSLPDPWYDSESSALTALAAAIQAAFTAAGIVNSVCTYESFRIKVTNGHITQTSTSIFTALLNLVEAGMSPPLGGEATSGRWETIEDSEAVPTAADYKIDGITFHINTLPRKPSRSK